MKKIIIFMLVACLALTFIPAYAAEDVTVTVNGERLEFDQPPIIENDRTLVPVRAIFEALGCKVEYYAFDEQIVYAEKGSNFVTLVIGSDIMTKNSEEIKLDVPAKIVNDRTLIPLRAVSEAFDASVEWVESERSVIIESKRGAHNIKSETLSSKREGKISLEVNAVYPVIESNGDEFIEQINASLKKDAEDTVAYAEEFYNDMISEFDGDYEVICTFDMDYEVTLDRNGYISILETFDSYTGGAHPNSVKEGRIFDLKAKKELGAKDIFNDETFDAKNAVAERIADKVREYSDSEEHTEAVRSASIEEFDNAGIYLTDSAVHVFYVPYQIASYAEGYLTADIDYDSEYINVDLGDYDMPELVYEVDGNPTTGFEWLLTEKSDKLDVEINYIEPEGNLVGAGGTYVITVKGIKQGNASIKLEYKRAWEDFADRTLTYRFYVENDLGVTLISEE